MLPDQLCHVLELLLVDTCVMLNLLCLLFILAAKTFRMFYVQSLNTIQCSTM